jgi:hypothetical protein
MEPSTHTTLRKVPWNKGKWVGQKAPLRLKDIGAIRVRLQIGHRTRELALFNLAIDSKLRSCDLVGLRARDVCHGNLPAARAIVRSRCERVWHAHSAADKEPMRRATAPGPHEVGKHSALPRNRS